MRSFVVQCLRLLDLSAVPADLMFLEAKCCLRRRLIWAVRSVCLVLGCWDQAPPATTPSAVSGRLPTCSRLLLRVLLGMLDLMLVVRAVLAMVWVLEYVIQLVLLSELAVLASGWLEQGDMTFLTRQLVVQLALDGVRSARKCAWSALRRVRLVLKLMRFSPVVLRVHPHGSHVSTLHFIICVSFTALPSLHIIHTRVCLMHDVW